MNERAAGSPDPGLCAVCVNVRVVESRRGSRFFLCTLSEVDPRFPKYPRLPVLRCRGFRRAETDSSAPEAPRGSLRANEAGPR